ncbi:MAG TPA: (Fe-S)-binding protein, partial [Candidatus Hodarchaeales archaeon]|nr:(Fe-S)-binding protein [Candidatus Hodarchaeales archaeon]
FVLGQLRLVRKKVGIVHFIIFWGFIILFPTLLQTLLDGLLPGFTLPFFSSYGPFLLLKDITALLVFGAVIFGLTMRLIIKPDRYAGSHTGGGIIVLLLIMLIMVGLLGVNGFRGLLGEDPYVSWRPVSSFFVIPFSGMSEESLQLLIELFWWLHSGVALIFLPYLPGGKHFHIITAVPNVFFRSLDPPGKLSPLRPGEPEQAVGISKIGDFSWKNILDAYSCTECGKCQDVCPAYASQRILSPKILIMKTRMYIETIGRSLLQRQSKIPSTISEILGQQSVIPTLSQNLVGDIITKEELSECTTCFACSQECPVFVEHIDLIVGMRRWLTYQGVIGEKQRQVLEYLSRYGNSFGKPETMRAKWTTGLDFKIKDIRKEAAEFLWFVGDYASFDTASQEVTRSTAKVLHSLGIDFGILYESERNSGNDIRRAGEEGLFEELANHNISVMNSAKFSKVLTTDPHSYNTLKNEYSDFGFNKPVLHIIE